MKTRVCPCFSGIAYAECCKPLHDGTRRAASPEALMRSRYAAFALGLGDYLVLTLASDHPDRTHDQAALATALSRAKATQRFLGLTILESHAEGDHGEVRFRAHIFERGVDKSFTECSTFVKEAGAWRYASGVIEL
ncbi:MAG: YchJ family metal-binding protein [Polyangiaceae bacterium]